MPETGKIFGGPGPFLAGAQMLARQTAMSEYSLTYQSGPWFRYCVDYLLMAPVAFLAFVATMPRVWQEAGWPPGRCLFLFLFLLLLPMSLLGSGGINLRFALAWDPALRLLLAAGFFLAFPRRGWLALGFLAAADLAHFLVFFSDGQTYDPVTLYLLRALGIYRGGNLPPP